MASELMKWDIKISVWSLFSRYKIYMIALLLIIMIFLFNLDYVNNIIDQKIKIFFLFFVIIIIISNFLKRNITYTITEDGIYKTISKKSNDNNIFNRYMKFKANFFSSITKTGSDLFISYKFIKSYKIKNNKIIFKLKTFPFDWVLITNVVDIDKIKNIIDEQLSSIN